TRRAAWAAMGALVTGCGLFVDYASLYAGAGAGDAGGGPDATDAVDAGGNADGDAAEAAEAADGAACEGEPVWPAPDGGVPETATCNGVPGTSLLTSNDHCGRCGHACGGQNCAAGRCEPRAETTDNPGVTLVVLGAYGNEIYYFLAEQQLRAITDG